MVCFVLIVACLVGVSCAAPVDVSQDNGYVVSRPTDSVSLHSLAHLLKLQRNSQLPHLQKKHQPVNFQATPQFSTPQFTMKLKDSEELESQQRLHSFMSSLRSGGQKVNPGFTIKLDSIESVEDMRQNPNSPLDGVRGASVLKFDVDSVESRETLSTSTPFNIDHDSAESIEVGVRHFGRSQQTAPSGLPLNALSNPAPQTLAVSSILASLRNTNDFSEPSSFKNSDSLEDYFLFNLKKTSSAPTLHQATQGDSSFESEEVAPCPAGQLRHGLRCVSPHVTRNIFVFGRGKESAESDAKSFDQKTLPPPELEYNIIFVQGSQKREKPVVIPPPQKKTVVYVLEDQPESSEGFIQTPTYPEHDPEVYYIKVKPDGNPELPGGIDFNTAFKRAQKNNGNPMSQTRFIDNSIESAESLEVDQDDDLVSVETDSVEFGLSSKPFLKHASTVAGSTVGVPLPPVVSPEVPVVRTAGTTLPSVSTANGVLRQETGVPLPEIVSAQILSTSSAGVPLPAVVSPESISASAVGVALPTIASPSVTSDVAPLLTTTTVGVPLLAPEVQVTKSGVSPMFGVSLSTFNTFSEDGQTNAGEVTGVPMSSKNSAAVALDAVGVPLPNSESSVITVPLPMLKKMLANLPGNQDALLTSLTFNNIAQDATFSSPVPQMVGVPLPSFKEPLSTIQASQSAVRDNVVVPQTIGVPLPAPNSIFSGNTVSTPVLQPISALQSNIVSPQTFGVALPSPNSVLPGNTVPAALPQSNPSFQGNNVSPQTFGVPLPPINSVLPLNTRTTLPQAAPAPTGVPLPSFLAPVQRQLRSSVPDSKSTQTDFLNGNINLDLLNEETLLALLQIMNNQ